MKSLLVCTDGSDYSSAACKYACWLAKRQESQIDVLYVSDLRQFEFSIVTDLTGSIGIEPYQGVLAQLQEMEAQKAEMLEEATHLFFKKENLQSSVHFHHATGLVVDRLNDFEKRVTPPDLIILGKRGENADFAADHLGSTMERVVRASKSPCLVTPHTFRNINKMVLAYDGGTSCQKAIDFIVNSPTLRDLELHIVTVDEGNNSPQAAEHLHQAEAALKSHGIHPICKILHGLAESTISHYVESEGIDLLIMGAYGHSRIRYLIIGSTTTDLIRRCHIPVLLFR